MERTFWQHLTLSLALAALAAPCAQAVTFSDISAGFDPVHHCTSAWVDYDNDGDLDVFLNGQTNGLSYITRLYQNNGGSFTLITGTGLPDLGYDNGTARSSWGDFDNDGYVDVLMIGVTGGSSPVRATQLYKNNSGNGTFSLVTVTPSLIDVTRGATAWGDYDNDGDLDILVTGLGAPPNRVATVYRNDGANGGPLAWTFTDTDPINNSNPLLNYFAKVMSSEGAWGDYDKDGDLDLVVIGSDINGVARTRIYRNDGGVLVNANVTTLVDLASGFSAWGDYNNDGYLDLAIMGIGNVSPYNTGSFFVYRNNQDGTFSLAASYTSGYLNNGSMAWGDGNNDGKLDLLVTGSDGNSTPITALLYGNGSGSFTMDTSSGLLNLMEGQAVWGDYDNDGRLDILLSGRGLSSTSVTTRIYKNNTSVANTAPTRPSVLSSLGATSTSVSLRWLAGSDAQTPVATLNYNLVVRETVSGHVIVPPMANGTSGYRRLPQLGNTDHSREWSIGGLQPGTSYEACVQTIDQGLMASDFRCTSVTTSTLSADMMIGDCASDVGAEPNGTCSSIWLSPNIWVRNSNDNGTVHQTPIYGQDNYIYVKLKNIGQEILPNGFVHVYFSKGGTSSNWPTSWIGFYNNSPVLYGDFIGQAQIQGIFPSDETVAVIKWAAAKVPNPGDFHDPNDDPHHFCLLARFVSASDPMTLPEGTSTADNTDNSNNIAWHNIMVLRPGEPDPWGGHSWHGGIEVGSVDNADRLATFGFRAEGLDGVSDDNILRYATLKVTLPEVLYDRWQDRGGVGQGISSKEAGERSFFVTSPDAYIQGISFDVGEQFPVYVEVTYSKENDPADKRVFRWDVIQYEEGRESPVGGETLLIHMSNDEADDMKSP